MSNVSEVKHYSMDNLEKLDFKGFFSFFDDRIPYEDLLVHKIKTLTGKQLSSFLIKLDLEEYKSLEKDNALLRKEIRRYKCGYAFLFSIFGAYSGYDLSNYAPHSSKLQYAIIGTVALGLFGSLVGKAWTEVEKSEVRLTIYRNRLMRLDLKIQAIKGRLLLLDQDNEEAIQLEIAESYFTIIKQDVERLYSPLFISSKKS